MLKVSVIVPFANDAQFIGQCLDAITNQSYQNIEVLLINNKSTDGSDNICRQRVSRDPRIKIIYTNSHTSDAVAKNIGLKMATGDLITFICPQDRITNYLLQMGVPIIEDQHCDIVVAPYQVIDDANNLVKALALPDNQYNGIYANKQWLEISNTDLQPFSDIIWAKIYRKELFQNLRFPDRPAADSYVSWKLTLLAQYVAFISSLGYQHRQVKQRENIKLPDRINALEEQIVTLTLAGDQVGYLKKRYQMMLQQLVQAGDPNGDARVKLQLLYRLAKQSGDAE